MNQYEEELQKRMEGGQTSKGEVWDEKIYREIFSTLKKDPGYELPSDFADRVTDRIMEKRKDDFSKDYICLGLGIFLMIILFFASIFYTGFKFDLGFLNGMADYGGLVVFGIFFIALLNWLDKELVRGQHVQH